MSKKYRISNGSESLEFTKAQWSDALNTASQCTPSYQFEIYGEQVSRDVFVDKCQESKTKWRSHYREITVSNGVGAGRTVNGYKTVLIRA